MLWLVDLYALTLSFQYCYFVFPRQIRWRSWSQSQYWKDKVNAYNLTKKHHLIFQFSNLDHNLVLIILYHPKEYV